MKKVFSDFCYLAISLSRYLALILVALLYSCTLDDIEDKPITSNTSKKKAQLTNLTYEDLKNESAVINIVNQIQQYNNGVARGVFDETFQMTLDTNKIVKIESELRHSYTFKILEDSLDTNITRNLVLDYISQEYGYFAYIFEYNLTANEMESVQRGEFVDLQNHLSLYTYDTDFSSNMVNGLEFCTNVVFIAEQACSAGLHSYSMGNAGDCRLGAKDQPQPATFVIQTSICDNGGGGGTVSSPPMPGTWNPGSGGGGTGYGSVTTYPGNPTNPGSPNNNPNPDREPIDNFLNGIETTPILNLASIEGRFYNNLPASLQYFWDYDLSVLQKNQILDFLENNKEPGQLYPTQEAEAFAKEVIKAYENETLISAFPFVKYPDGQEGIDYRNNYPKLTEYLQNQLPTVKGNTTIVNKIVQYGDLTEEEVKKELEWNEGPTIKIVQLDNYCSTCSTNTYGLFQGNNPDILLIDIDLVNDMENTNTGTELADAFSFLIGVTILHEFVHYSEYQDGTWNNPESGVLFEQDVYGQTVWRSNANIILKSN